MPTVVVLSGAGMSAESGIKTFRDSNGLWENHDIMTVASIEGWYKNPELVTEFYNQRRAQLAEVEPNAGHIALKHLESAYRTVIITQNVDDLHERAGSKHIVHLHGELTKMRSTQYQSDVYEVGYDEKPYGTLCPKGTLLRPHIVWFGEAVPMMEEAIKLTQEADIFIIVGTSLEVYPAAGLVDYTRSDCRKFLIDPSRHSELKMPGLRVISDTAAKALPALVNQLLAEQA
jgi:NAD-dependent deacetylase